MAEAVQDQAANIPIAVTSESDLDNLTKSENQNLECEEYNTNSLDDKDTTQFSQENKPDVITVNPAEKRESGEKTAIQIPIDVNVTEDATAELGNTERSKLVIRSPTVRFSNSSRGEQSEEVEVIEYSDTEMIGSGENTTDRCCSLCSGPHIVFLTVLMFPFVLIISLVVAFYYGALTWYNLLIYFSEERTLWHKVLICPVLILTFPLTVGFTSLAVAVYAAMVQISWHFSRWRERVFDCEKGFYGWLCYKLNVQMCAPYDMEMISDDSVLQPIRT